MEARLNLERITKVKESTHGVDHVTEGAVTKKAFNVRSANEVLRCCRTAHSKHAL